MDPALRLENLGKSFGDVAAVNGLSFTVNEGEIFGLIGPDGAGKTTTLRLLASIMKPDAGEAWVAGRHIVRDAEAVKKTIGYMSQRLGLYADLSVLENIHFFADIYSVPRRGREATIDKLLSFANLSPFKKRLAGNLSGGMRQKLGLACALIHTPKILLLDEPTNGLDPVSRREFWRNLDQLLHQKVTILISTPYLDEAERCHRIGLLHKGKPLAIGRPDEIKRLMRGSILQVFTRDTRQAFESLRLRLSSGRANLFGDRIHVVSTTPEQTTGEIRAVLQAGGMASPDIRPRAPELEDAFLSILTDSNTATSHD